MTTGPRRSKSAASCYRIRAAWLTKELVMRTEAVLAAVAMLAAGILAPVVGLAETDPSAAQIVKSLTPTGLSGPTRGIRVAPAATSPVATAGGGADDQPERAVRHRVRRSHIGGDSCPRQPRQGTERPVSGCLPVPHRGPHRHRRHARVQPGVVGPARRRRGRLSSPPTSTSIAAVCRRSAWVRITADSHARSDPRAAKPPRAGGQHR